jgi:hypothetical protein
MKPSQITPYERMRNAVAGRCMFTYYDDFLEDYVCFKTDEVCKTKPVERDLCLSFLEMAIEVDR